MQHVLIAASEQSAQGLEELLGTRYRDTRITQAHSGSKARRLLLELHCDTVIISAPLSDENGLELAVECARADRGVLLLVKAQFADEISARVEQHGVFVLEKPLHTQFFFRSLRLLTAAGNRMKGLEKEKLGLQKKIEEIKLVNRAKYALIEYLGLTEPQAHRYIEKQAMDLRQTKGETARGILKTYEA